jgi:DNA repair protein SbcD/Mre11
VGTGIVRFIHAADVHLDSPLLGLDSYEGAPVEAIRRATRRALENLVDLAITERVAFVLLAGDLYDGDWRDASTGLFFIAQMSRLDQSGIPVVSLSGNHDAASRITGKLPYPKNVHLLPVEQAGTIPFDSLRIAVHGQGYARQAEDRNLAASYPAPVPGFFNVGMLHTALEGREGHEPYAPCSLSELFAKGYDYWALGHVHQRESVNGSNHPRVEYPGNLQGRHIRETGPKGCLLVSVGTDLRCEPEFRPLDVFRWALVQIDVSGMTSRDEIVDAVAAGFSDRLEAEGSLGQALGVRVELMGETPLQQTLEAESFRLTDELRSRAIAESGGRLWVEKLVIRTSGPSASAESDRAVTEDALTEIAGVIAELRADPSLVSSLLKEGDCGDLFKKLPQEARLGQGGDDPTGALALATYLARAESILGAALRSSETDR